MKLSLVATTIFILTLGLYTPKVTAAPIKTPKTFKEWCQQKASLPQETKRTVEALLLPVRSFFLEFEKLPKK